MRRYLLCAAAVAMLLCAGQASTALVIDYDVTIDYAVDYVTIMEGNNPDPPTTVNFVEPADVNEVEVLDSSVLNIYSGAVVSDELEAPDSSTINIYGGHVSEADLGGQSTLNVYSGGVGRLEAFGSSEVIISGGDTESLSVCEAATADIFGGNTIFDLSAGPGLDDQDSIITIYGSGFNYPPGPIPDASGILTGTLADGSPLDAPFRIDSNASIVLVVPEPSCLGLLITAAVGLLAYVWHRRRRP